ncbi:hypothetical protein T484DRAFT_1639185, partial [Baffinella frigidus]
RNPKPETRNPEPENRNPKLETLNPQPQTSNPKPETPTQVKYSEIDEEGGGEGAAWGGVLGAEDRESLMRMPRGLKRSASPTFKTISQPDTEAGLDQPELYEVPLEAHREVGRCSLLFASVAHENKHTMPNVDDVVPAWSTFTIVSRGHTCDNRSSSIKG